jgi:hypothetical protein
MYIDDACIDPTLALNWHLDPNDHLAYKTDSGGVERGFEFFDYRELLKRIRWLFLDNGVKPKIVLHATQTPYYPIFSFADLLVEGEDRYLGVEGEARDFITTWGLPRLRYANAEKWGVPVYWMPILSPGTPLKTTGMPMFRWYFQQRRSHVADLLLHDVGGDFGFYRRDVTAAGADANQSRFIGYWDPDNPLMPATPNTYVSVYQTSTNLALVLVNAMASETNFSFKVDTVRIKALLKSDTFVLRDADRATIPPPDLTIEMIKKEAALRLVDTTLADRDEEALYAMIDVMFLEKEQETKKANDPEAFFDYHNFRYTNDLLRLKIQTDDYRLLTLSPCQR